MTTIEPPVPLCLLIADRVYQDRETGNNIIAGTFNTIAVDRLPFQYPQLSIFFQVTGVSRPVDLRLVIEFADDGRTIFEIGGPIEVNDPIKVLSKTIRVNGLPVDRAGKYWVQLRSEGEILIQAPLYVKLIERRKK